jgi:fatty acid desaturase
VIQESAISAEIDDFQAKSLVRDLHRASPAIYWTDLILTSTVGWSCFSLAVMLPPFSRAMLIAGLVAVVALYRGLCFIHEISHQNSRTLPGFEAAWNVLIGFPLLMPSIVYVGVHQDHHKISTYGTAQDPEYLPFARSTGMTITFALESFFIPAALLIRFLILSPLGLLSERIQQWLVVHASSLTINLRYVRNAPPAVVSTARHQSIAILVGWTVAIGLACLGWIPWRIFAVWFIVCAFASFVNTLRTLGAHAYESSGQQLDRMGQLNDSIDTPGKFWTELWAPVGLRYHALHHYFPGIPYHNLPEAYRRLINSLPLSTAYQKMSSPSLPYSLAMLIRKGFRGLHQRLESE